MFELPPLPYAPDALEPLISRATMETHHGKHHAAYIKTTNTLLAERGVNGGALETIVRQARREQQTKLFNNAAQAWNHAFFWSSLSPERQEPAGGLAKALQTTFGGVERFQEQCIAAGVGHFASGWVWLVADRDGGLSLRDLHDADTPVVDDTLTPILVCDVWEHAYYIDYRHERAKFLDAVVKNALNWRFAESQYEAARSGGSGWVFPS